MARPLALSQALGIVHDIADASRYSILFGSIPGAVDSRPLTVQCFQAEAPGIQNQMYTATVGGHTLNFRGRIEFGNQMTFAFYVDGNGDAMSILQNWHEQVVGTETGDSQGYIDDYSVDPTLSLFDTTGREYATYKIYRLYPINVAQIQLDGGNSSAMVCQVTCAFTYHESSTRQTL